MIKIRVVGHIWRDFASRVLNNEKNIVETTEAQLDIQPCFVPFGGDSSLTMRTSKCWFLVISIIRLARRIGQIATR